MKLPDPLVAPPQDVAKTWQTQLRFENSFAHLSAEHYTRLEPTPLGSPNFMHINNVGLDLLGLPHSVAHNSNFVDVFIGNAVLTGSAPLASVYSGHQFGQWAGQLGDGRAILLGQVVNDNQRWELQLKGGGKTPYSRFADGRAVLRSSIREYLCAEAMHHLGIPTTRSLCIAGAADVVLRESLETAAVVARMAPSFIRFGHFEHWASLNKLTQLQQLTDYVIEQLYPSARQGIGANGRRYDNPVAALLSLVVHNTALMVSGWQSVGFCHGVMNTDNMSILGLTIDYGPFGFMDSFDANHICNHTDEQGRYAYAMQPSIAHWNLYCLAQALLPLMPHQDQTQLDYTRSVVDEFSVTFAADFDARLHAKLGLATLHKDDDQLFAELFSLLHASHVDFTVFFRTLCSLKLSNPSSDHALRDLCIDRERLDAWLMQYRARLSAENNDDASREARMKTVNPRIVLRNYMAQVAIEKAQQSNDASEVDRLMRSLRQPFDDIAEFDCDAKAPPHWAQTISVSCSS